MGQRLQVHQFVPGIDYRRVPATILASANLHTITLHAKQRAISGSYGIAAYGRRGLIYYIKQGKIVGGIVTGIYNNEIWHV